MTGPDRPRWPRRLSAPGTPSKAIKAGPGYAPEAFQGKRGFFAWQIGCDNRQCSRTKHAIFWRK